MKAISHRFFTIVLFFDFLYSLYNYIDDFSARDNNFLTAFYILLNLLPLAVLIFLSKKIYQIQNKEQLSKIKIALICYFVFDVCMGFVSYIIDVPFFINSLFYSNGWWFNIVYLLKYQFYYFGINLTITVFYWVAYAFLLGEISKLINPPAISASTLESDSAPASGKEKTSPSYKISIASIILLCIQSVFDIVIFAAMQEQKNTSGEHAMGAVIVILLLIIVKVIISLPTVILSIIGIVMGKQSKNKDLKYNQKGLKRNIVCLVISELQVLLLW